MFQVRQYNCSKELSSNERFCLNRPSDTLRELFMKQSALKNIEEAEKLFNLCKELRIHITPPMLSNAIVIYSKLDQVDKARAALDKLRNLYPTFKLDLYKIVDYAKALVNSGDMKAARAVLQLYRPQTTVNVENVKINVLHLLYAVVDWAVQNSPAENVTTQLLDELVESNYCQHSNMLSGMIIKEHLAKKQLREAVGEFERICTERRHLSQTLTLMKLLTQIHNSPSDELGAAHNVSKDEAKALLQKVIDISKKKDPASTDSNLLLAFAYTGTETQVRKLLMNPSISISGPFIMTYFERCKNDDDSIIAMTKLVKCSRGLRHDILREENLLEIILNHLSAKKDFKVAREIYDDLYSDDDSRVSKKIAKQFVDLFSATGQEVPQRLRLFSYEK